jgi:hypothetical protein
MQNALKDCTGSIHIAAQILHGMSSQQFTITFTNEKIWRFFQERPGMNPETSLLLFIDMLEKITLDTSALNTSLAAQLVSGMQKLENQIHGVAETLSRSQSDLLINFYGKLTESKREYMHDVKTLMTTNVSEQIAPLLRDQNAVLLSKTHLILNEIMPKNEDTVSRHITEAVNTLHKAIANDTATLLQSSLSKGTLEDFLKNLDARFNNTLSTSQQLYGATEQRLDTNLRAIDANFHVLKDMSTHSQHVVEAMNGHVSDMLRRMDNSSTKGKVSENIVFSILHTLYPTAQIESVGTTKETGDIMLIRQDKPTILIENKNWDRNVVQEEVRKFIRDIETQNCSGLFLAQNFGVANKQNFEINLHNGHVLLYLHEVHNDAEKIKVAISIIDHFKAKLEELDTKSDVDTISKELLVAINHEYQMHITAKLNLVKTIKDSTQKILKQIDEFQIPSLDHFLSSRFAFSTSKFVCQYCEFVGKNQQSLSGHQRACPAKKEGQDITGQQNIVTTIVTPVAKKVKVT